MFCAQCAALIVMSSDNKGLENTLGLVMAAGFSRRFGEQDKRCAEYAGTTLLSASLSNLLPAFRTPAGKYQLTVVIRPEDSPQDLGIPAECTVIRAPSAAQGLSASIADAVTEINLDMQWQQITSLALMLGDMPEIKQQTIALLRRQATEHNIVRPVFQQQPGHPVLFGRTFWTQLMKGTDDQGGRQVIKNTPDSFLAIATNDAGVIYDIDTPQQIKVTATD